MRAKFINEYYDEYHNYIEDNYEYYYDYCCISPKSSEELEYIIDNMVEITPEQFLRKIKLEQINNSLNYGIKYKNKEQLIKDLGNSYYRVKDKNIDAYILRNSAIEYVFKKQ